jgi:polysaccharide export outer membrane protein
MTMGRTKPSAWRAAIGIGALCAATGCAGGPLAARPVPHPSVVRASAGSAADNVARLTQLRAERGSAQKDSDYMLGKGDLVSVRAYDLDDLNQKVRVEADGSIRLPLLNTVDVGGHTVAQVEEDLTRRLGSFMYEPHVTVFVEEYRSQQVAVMGAVLKPGLVSHIGRNATVLETISAAGGFTPEAGSLIYFTPADGHAALDAAQLVVASDNGPVGGPAPLVLDTNEIDEAAKRAFFTLPVREGDVIRIPPGGDFYAMGWLEKPGTYPLRSGLTLRGAIAAAQGLTFPANRDDVRIYSPGPSGETLMRKVNYDQIASLQAPDVFIHDGDVIEVGTSYSKMVPWVGYQMIKTVIHVGYKLAP